MDNENLDQCIANLNLNFLKEIKLYEIIMDLTQKENDSIIGGAIEVSLKYINEKQSLLEEIQKIEQEQVELRKVWTLYRHKATQQGKAELKVNLAALTKLLDTVIALEKRNEKFLLQQISKEKDKRFINIPSQNVAKAYKKIEKKIKFFISLALF